MKNIRRDGFKKMLDIPTKIQVSLLNEYCFYGLKIPYTSQDSFQCIEYDYVDPTSWLFRIGNDFFGSHFRILYHNWTTYVYYLGKELHQPYSEVLNMPMYEMLLLFDMFQEDVEKQNSDSEEQTTQMNDEMERMRHNVDSMQRMNMNNVNLNMPKMPEIKIPTKF